MRCTACITTRHSRTIHPPPRLIPMVLGQCNPTRLAITCQKGWKAGSWRAGSAANASPFRLLRSIAKVCGLTDVDCCSIAACDRETGRARCTQRIESATIEAVPQLVEYAGVRCSRTAVDLIQEGKTYCGVRSTTPILVHCCTPQPRAVLYSL